MAGKTRKLKRPDWDSYFMQIAQVVALRSNCSRRQVAAVIVQDCRIISTGYNGTPRGIKNCCHGEENAIVQAAYHGISVKDATLYTTFSPCLLCAKMIINAGIKEVVYKERYSIDDTSKRILKEAGVKLRPLIEKEA